MLAASGTHLSVSNAHRRIPTAADPSTVSRALTRMTFASIVHAITDHAGRPMYGLADRPHQHSVCGDCGHLSEISAPAARVPELSEVATAVFYSTCDNCAFGAADRI
ncbi:transcriptional repressor [Catellatospora citrea]|uniref:Fe2+ or Zn2+ uptake regulation protein n=1 Tax=Catellatospora citrea TaxID=53366 RepID=A0A8J3KN94_9ACTN|nr:transcriptional repressor [Catellatospora citrea]RKE10486.1 Fe2+ or Zn2+ uptake regulation protein [Catellatospora citrea]GIF99004.1 hypothetical protein Cci01nite_40980 [Catellatospora citrea]